MTTPLWRGSALATLFKQNDFSTDITGISIDTRTLQPGDLFIALSDIRDGHDFVKQAVEAGAAAVMVHRDVEVEVPQLRVQDTLDGLWQLGRGARKRFKGKVVALTGSSGKTTLRHWFEHILAGIGPCHASVGSLNNHWGVPLSLARMPQHAEFAILEVGTNHPGEITPLSHLVAPHVSILLNVLPAHIGNFSGIDALTKEKLSIADGLNDGGKFVVPFHLKDQTPWSDCLTFGADGANVTTETWAANSGTQLKVSLNDQDYDGFLPFHGSERVESASALVAALAALDVDLSRALPRLSDLPLPAGRGNLHLIKGVVIVDDSYNANPGSMGMSLRSFSRQQAKRKFAFLGEMLELGDDAGRYHQEMADEASGIDQVFSFGDGFSTSSFVSPREHFAAVEDFPIEHFAAGLQEGDAILIKGSNKVFWLKDFVGRLISETERHSSSSSEST